MTPKTQERIDRILNQVEHTMHGYDALSRDLETILKEQDRDTRYACAEAVLALPHDMTHLDAYHACIDIQAL